MSRTISELESHIEGFRRVKMIDILFGESLVMSVKTPMEAAHYIKDKTRCKASYDSVCSAVSKCLFGVQYTTRGYRCSWETSIFVKALMFVLRKLSMRVLIMLLPCWIRFVALKRRTLRGWRIFLSVSKGIPLGSANI